MTDSNPTQIEDHDAGICDARGRRVGFQSQTWGSGKEFVVCLQTTRNECEFGASQRLHYFATQHERQAWIEQTVTKRIAAAVKKFQTI